MKEKEGKKGLALILDGVSPDDEEAGESYDEAETEAMQAFMDAKTVEAKASALKDFIKLCSGA